MRWWNWPGYYHRYYQRSPADLNAAEVQAFLLCRRDPRHESTWLMLVDVQETQLREVEAAMARHRKDGVVIQDFVHVLEYLWKEPLSASTAMASRKPKPGC